MADNQSQATSQETQQSQASEGGGAAATPEQELEALRGQLAERDAVIADHAGEMATAAARYREARIAASPHLPPALITGATIADVDASITAAEAVLTSVREHDAATARRPIGFQPGQGGGERGVDTSKLTPQQKIAAGLERRA